jgi:hypothetical protein
VALNKAAITRLSTWVTLPVFLLPVTGGPMSLR